ncbi:MAG: hypothetical protein K6F32_02595 [Bacilli bacterium]|nr:hypothetical protein [Bacilli bacterium]
MKPIFKAFAILSSLALVSCADAIKAIDEALGNIVPIATKMFATPKVFSDKASIYVTAFEQADFYTFFEGGEEIASIRAEDALRVTNADYVASLSYSSSTNAENSSGDVYFDIGLKDTVIKDCHGEYVYEFLMDFDDLHYHDVTVVANSDSAAIASSEKSAAVTLSMPKLETPESVYLVGNALSWSPVKYADGYLVRKSDLYNSYYEDVKTVTEPGIALDEEMLATLDSTNYHVTAIYSSKNMESAYSEETDTFTRELPLGEVIVPSMCTELEIPNENSGSRYFTLTTRQEKFVAKIIDANISYVEEQEIPYFIGYNRRVADDDAGVELQISGFNSLTFRHGSSYAHNYQFFNVPSLRVSTEEPSSDLPTLDLYCYSYSTDDILFNLPSIEAYYSALSLHAYSNAGLSTAQTDFRLESLALYHAQGAFYGYNAQVTGGDGHHALRVEKPIYSTDSVLYVVGGNGAKGENGTGGTNGTSGSSATKGGDGEDGGKGGNGGNAIAYATFDERTGGVIHLAAGKGGDGGNGGKGGKGGNGKDGSADLISTTNGTNGANGGNGGNGGDGSAALISTTDGTNGANGGNGGNGGEGGKGGKAIAAGTSISQLKSIVPGLIYEEDVDGEYGLGGDGGNGGNGGSGATWLWNTASAGKAGKGGKGGSSGPVEGGEASGQTGGKGAGR